MSRFLKTILGRALAVVAGLSLPAQAFACATCYGQSDSPLAQGMNWGIMTLLGVIVSVLTGIVVFFVHVGRKSSTLDSSVTGENQTAKNQ